MAVKGARRVAATLALVFGGWTAAVADEPSGALLSFGAGYFDVFSQVNTAADFRVEYRSDAHWGFLRHWGGVEVTTDGGFWIGGGMQLEIMPWKGLVLSLASGPGYYHQGSGKDLGGALEFRTTGEIGWQSSIGTRLTLSISHHSNADIYDHNPGVETIMLTYQIPLENLFN